MSETVQSRLKKEPEYLVWTNMKARCSTPSSSRYARYGGRGIKVCERWAVSYPAFLADMGRRPSPRHQLDRKDNDGDYTPENCRWVTPSEQASNKSTTRWIEVGNDRRTLQEWADRLGSDPQTISDRLERGWSPGDAVTTPPRSQKQGEVMLSLDGRRLRLFEWVKETGLSAATISKRLGRGWTVREALTTLSGART